MSEKINIENCRIAFASDLFVAKAVNGGKPRYSSSFLIQPTHPAVVKLRECMQRVANDKWQAKGPAIYKALEAQDKLCLHDGNLKDYAGYAGHLYISGARRPEDGAPRVVHRNPNIAIAASDGVIYSGCRVIAYLEIWAQDNTSFGKRINATIRGVQFFADDTRFSGTGTAGDDEFQKLEAVETDDLMA